MRPCKVDGSAGDRLDLPVPMELGAIVGRDGGHRQCGTLDRLDQGLGDRCAGAIGHLLDQQQPGHALHQRDDAGLFPADPLHRVDFPVAYLLAFVDHVRAFVDHPLALLAPAPIRPVVALATAVALPQMSIQVTAPLPIPTDVTVDRLIADRQAATGQDSCDLLRAPLLVAQKPLDAGPLVSAEMAAAAASPSTPHRPLMGMARPVGPIVAVAAVALDFTPDRAARSTGLPGDLTGTTPLTTQLSDHVSFFPGELSVLHGITLAGVHPSVGQLTLLFKPGVALSLSIPARGLASEARLRTVGPAPRLRRQRARQTTVKPGIAAARNLTVRSS